MVRFTAEEVKDLIIAFFIISICFTILYSRRNLSTGIEILPMAMVGVGFGFIFHELGHKFSSIHFGYWAEFKIWPQGLLIAFITSFFGFVFAAPGAVYTFGNFISDRENGIISLCGPIVNIALALIFLAVAVIIYPSAFVNQNALFGFLICNMGFNINSYLAVFNLLPILNLDGSKVLRWNGVAWLISIAIAALLTYLSMTMGVESIVRSIIGI
ncbi:MAG: site-2 protease family protein [Methanobrevibacter sp.]|nr:site-2 protease family protein [Methanobrevibacter sp.]